MRQRAGNLPPPKPKPLTDDIFVPPEITDGTWTPFNDASSRPHAAFACFYAAEPAGHQFLGQRASKLSIIASRREASAATLWRHAARACFDDDAAVLQWEEAIEPEPVKAFKVARSPRPVPGDAFLRLSLALSRHRALPESVIDQDQCRCSVRRAPGAAAEQLQRRLQRRQRRAG